MSSVTLDLETLSTEQNATILTFGSVKFNPYTDIEPFAPMYYRLDVDEQLASGRAVDENTLAWWSKQPAAIRDEAFAEDDRTPVAKFLDDLNRYFVGVGDIWAQGPIFDLVILENLYKQNNRPIPWWYYQVSDSRTIFKLVGDPREKHKDVHHNALADAYAQAIGIQQICKHFNITEKITW